jgi:hypothetical protein
VRKLSMAIRNEHVIESNRFFEFLNVASEVVVRREGENAF